jgi:hypothetical protein
MITSKNKLEYDKLITRVYKLHKYRISHRLSSLRDYVEDLLRLYDVAEDTFSLNKAFSWLTYGGRDYWGRLDKLLGHCEDNAHKFKGKPEYDKLIKQVKELHEWLTSRGLCSIEKHFEFKQYISNLYKLYDIAANIDRLGCAFHWKENGGEDYWRKLDTMLREYEIGTRQTV